MKKSPYPLPTSCPPNAIIHKQEGPRDLGMWCVLLRIPYRQDVIHLARHLTKRSATSHAKRVNDAIRLK